MKILYLWALYIVIAACSSTHVSYSYNKQTDFDTYRTFNFIADEAALPSDSANRKLLINAASHQLQAKGLSKSDHPDLLVDVKLLIRQMKKEGLADGRTYMITPNLYVRSEQTSQTNKYKIATLFIRILDSHKKQMLWQGQGSRTTIGSPYTPNLHRAVAQIFKKYPPKVKRN